MSGDRSEAARDMVRLLAWQDTSMTSEDLASRVGARPVWAALELTRMRAQGVVADTPTGYKLGPCAVVGVRGFVGRVVPPGGWG